MAEILQNPRTADVIARPAWIPRSRGDSIVSLTSASPNPSVPFNTPASRSVLGDQAAHTDTHITLDAPGTLQRVDSTLSAVQELHNETVDDEQHVPTVPDNTPCHGSPASYRYTIRNLPSIDEKLENLPSAVTSPTSIMSFSPAPSVMGERGQGERAPYGLISIALGSPRDVDFELVEKPSVSSQLAATPRDLLSPLPPGMLSPLPIVPLTVENLAGVPEITDWHDTIEEDLDRDLTRLANLANDDFQMDPSATAAEHYHRRLLRLLSKSNRRYTITELGEAVVSTMAERGSLLDIRPSMVTNFEFQNLRSKVHDVQGVFSALLAHLSKNNKEVDKLSATFEELMKHWEGKNGA